VSAAAAAANANANANANGSATAAASADPGPAAAATPAGGGPSSPVISPNSLDEEGDILWYSPSPERRRSPLVRNISAESVSPLPTVSPADKLRHIIKGRKERRKGLLSPPAPADRTTASAFKVRDEIFSTPVARWDEGVPRTTANAPDAISRHSRSRSSPPRVIAPRATEAPPTAQKTPDQLHEQVHKNGTFCDFLLF